MADEIDSRMEQIRLKNEELEKKHKEIMEDELEAKKQNAAIVSSEKGENYKHPYDELELDYDVKDEERQEHSKNANAKVKNTRKPILNKKSLDEIPPDPVNFLREDDGSEAVKSGQDQPRPPQQEQQQNRNRKPPQQRPRGGPYNNNNRNTPNAPNNNENPSFRPPREHYQQQNNNNSRPRDHQNMRRQNNAQDNKMETQNSPATTQQQQQQPRRPHPQALRNERRTISSTAVTSSNPDALNEHESINKDVSPPHANRQQRRPTQKPPRSNNKEQSSDRNNLTVQLTDEVRSVKIKSVERVGSGRLQHAIANNLSSEGNDNLEENAQTSADGNRGKNRNPNKNKRNFKPKAPQTPEFHHPILDKIVISKTSVQERLLRSRMSEDASPIESKVEVDLSSAATPEIIENNEGN